MTISGFKYDTEAAALAAIQSINNALGIPVNTNSVTTTYCQSFQDINGSWCVAADDVTTKYLGQPIDITIPDPPAEI